MSPFNWVNSELGSLAHSLQHPVGPLVMLRSVVEMIETINLCLLFYGINTQHKARRVLKCLGVATPEQWANIGICNFSTLDILGQTSLCRRDCSGHRGMLSIITSF